MSDKWFDTSVSREKCASWLALINAPVTPKGAIASRELRDEILMDLGTEVASNYAAEYAPVETADECCI